MDMDVAGLEQLGVEAEARRSALDQRQRRLGALLHHVAELAGQDQTALAGHPGRLDEQYVAADRRPGEPGRDPGDAGAHRDLALEAPRPEDFGEVVGRDPDMLGAAFGNLHRHAAQRRADFALQVAHAGFARVVADDRVQRVVVDFGLFRLEAVRGYLPGDEIAAGDLEFFVLGVAGQVDDLHAVAQRARDVSSTLAVVMNMTFERSNGTPR